jgi:tetratricopeptide (TPR) repeat protein
MTNLDLARPCQAGRHGARPFRVVILNRINQTVRNGDLGNALWILGRLEEAVAAYREALKEYTREQVPLDWAMTQNNLGTALQTLGERETGTGRLEEARAAIEMAWDVYQEAGLYLSDPSFETRLRSIDDLIAHRHSGS